VQSLFNEHLLFLFNKLAESYEFVATKAFKDFNNVLDEAGSERREHLLPGTDQNNHAIILRFTNLKKQGNLSSVIKTIMTSMDLKKSELLLLKVSLMIKNFLIQSSMRMILLN